MSSFESVYRKILNRKRKPAKRSADLQLGSTDSGRAQFKPAEPKRATGDGEPVERMTIREIKAHRGHASKGRGNRGGIRKSGGKAG